MKENSKKNSAVILIAIAVITIVIWQIPGGFYILYPFTILGTWFHEMGHGLTAILLGGEFHSLEIYSNGSGLAKHSGGLFLANIGNAFVAAGGPLGPTFAGAIFIGLSRTKGIVRYLLILLGIVLLLSVIIWIRSLFGAVVIGLFGLIILLIAIKAKDEIKVFALQFLGVQAFVSVYLSFGYLFSDSGNVGGNNYVSDTGVIADNLFLPYWFWGGTIILISILLIYKSIRYAYKKTK